MRSYTEVIEDVRNNKRVDYEELRVALIIADDLLFNAEQNISSLLTDNKKYITKIISEIKELRKSTKDKPLEDYWNGNIPKLRD